MNRFSLVAATLALSLFCTPNVVSATNSLPQTPSEWMDFLEKQSINQEDYGNSDQNFVTDSLPLVKDSAQKPDPNVIKIMIDPGHANYYNPSTVVNGYYESVMTWTLSNYLKEELEALGVQADLTKTSLEDDPDLQPRGHMSAGYDFFLSVHSNATSYSSIDYPIAICYQNLDWTDIDDTSRAVGQLLTDKVTEVMETRQKGIIWQRLSDNDRDGNGVNDDEWYGVLCGARYVGNAGRFNGTFFPYQLSCNSLAHAGQQPQKAGERRGKRLVYLLPHTKRIQSLYRRCGRRWQLICSRCGTNFNLLRTAGSRLLPCFRI